MKPQWVFRLGRCLRDKRGVAAVEFALLAPFLTLLALGAFEVPRAILIYQKVGRATTTVGDLVSQQAMGITESQLSDLFLAASETMQPFKLDSTTGAVVVSSVTRPSSSAAPTIAWQRTDGNSTVYVSHIGKQGDVPVLPQGFTVAVGDNVIICETIYDYKPVFGSVIYSGMQYYDIAYFRPRADTLDTISP